MSPITNSYTAKLETITSVGLFTFEILAEVKGFYRILFAFWVPIIFIKSYGAPADVLSVVYLHTH